MKARRVWQWCSGISLFGFAIFLFLLWYNGFLPVGADRARLRHALDLWWLPASVSIDRAASESWTDYIFEAEVSIDPTDLQKLLRGRSFSQDDFAYQPQTSAYRINGYIGFPIAAKWQWHQGDATCEVYSNSEHRKVLVRFMAD